MRLRRLTMLAVLVAAGPLLAGCENFDLDSLDVFHLNEKKKLPGDRKELFPGGVPGVSQGVPPEYLKGNQPAPDAAADATLPASKPGDGDATAAKPEAATASVEPAQPVEAPKPKPKRKPKPQTAQRAPAQVTIRPTVQQPAAAQQQQPAWPAPPPPQQQQQQQSPWPATNQPANNSPWPAPPAPGTFSR